MYNDDEDDDDYNDDDGLVKSISVFCFEFFFTIRFKSVVYKSGSIWRRVTFLHHLHLLLLVLLLYLLAKVSDDFTLYFRGGGNGCLIQ